MGVGSDFIGRYIGIENMNQPFRGRIVFQLLLLASLVACAPPLPLLNTVTSDDNYVVTSNIAYGDHPRQRLDIYVPLQGRSRNKVVIFFYGDRWQHGSKETYRFVAGALADSGFTVVIPNYRLFPDVRFPGFVNDAARAVRWIKENIRDYYGDPNSVYLVGYSAGGYIAAMLNLNENYLPRGTVRATVGVAGPYDFLPLAEGDLQDIFDSAPEPAITQPINFVNGNEPPMLLLSGDEDQRVNAGNSLRLAARIRSQGGRVQVILYPGVSHELIIGAVAPAFQDWAPTLRDITDFINTY